MMQRKWQVPVLLALFVCALCLFSACGGNEETPSVTTSVTTDAPDPAMTEASSDDGTAVSDEALPDVVTTAPEPEGPPSAYQQIPTTKDTTLIDSTEDQGVNGLPIGWYGAVHHVGCTWHGDIVVFEDLDFGTYDETLLTFVGLTMTWGTTAGEMHVMLDGPDGEVIAVVPVTKTAKYEIDAANLFSAMVETPISGVHDVYCKFVSGDTGSFFGIEFFRVPKNG